MNSTEEHHCVSSLLGLSLVDIYTVFLLGGEPLRLGPSFPQETHMLFHLFSPSLSAIPKLTNFLQPTK